MEAGGGTSVTSLVLFTECTGPGAAHSFTRVGPMSQNQSGNGIGRMSAVCRHLAYRGIPTFGAADLRSPMLSPTPHFYWRACISLSKSGTKTSSWEQELRKSKVS